MATFWTMTTLEHIICFGWASSTSAPAPGDPSWPPGLFLSDQPAGHRNEVPCLWFSRCSQKKPVKFLGPDTWKPWLFRVPLSELWNRACLVFTWMAEMEKLADAVDAVRANFFTGVQFFWFMYAVFAFFCYIFCIFALFCKILSASCTFFVC